MWPCLDEADKEERCGEELESTRCVSGVPTPQNSGVGAGEVMFHWLKKIRKYVPLSLGHLT